MLGGQAFNFDFEDGCYFGFTRDKVLQFKEINEKGKIYLLWQTYPEKDDLNYIKSYLRLDIDYVNILNKIQKDNYIKQAIKKYPNIRLLRQDFEQTLISFLISSNKNIKGIRSTIRNMNKKFGKSLNVLDKKIWLFPNTESLANADLEELLECKLGYRAKFIKDAARFILKNNLKKKFKETNESETREALLEINGVGDKIADCVLAFSLSFDNVTPLDVWAKRVLINFYKLSPKLKYEEMRLWTKNYFDGYAAWAGQFLYEYIRNKTTSLRD